MLQAIGATSASELNIERLGMFYETFVAMELQRQISCLDDRPRLFHSVTATSARSTSSSNTVTDPSRRWRSRPQQPFANVTSAG